MLAYAPCNIYLTFTPTPRFRVGLNIDCFHGYDSHTWLHIEIIHLWKFLKRSLVGLVIQPEDTHLPSLFTVLGSSPNPRVRKGPMLILT